MIVITTPTGQIGRQVLGNLLDSGEQRAGLSISRAADLSSLTHGESMARSTGWSIGSH